MSLLKIKVHSHIMLTIKKYFSIIIVVILEDHKVIYLMKDVCLYNPYLLV